MTSSPAFNSRPASSRRPRYDLQAGRLIVRNGAPLCTLHGVGQYDPVEVDELVVLIVKLLNE